MHYNKCTNLLHKFYIPLGGKFIDKISRFFCWKLEVDDLPHSFAIFLKAIHRWRNIHILNRLAIH